MAQDFDDPALEPTLARHSRATKHSQPAVSAASSARLSLPNYELGTLLERGGMGDIVVGHDRTIGRNVAIKQMRAYQPRPDEIARFLREAKIQARLEHHSTITRSLAERPNVSGMYISSALVGGTTKLPGVVARATYS